MRIPSDAMKRGCAAWLLALSLTVCPSCLPSPWAKRARAKREAGYESALSAYEQDLKAGMTRAEVEAYLGARHAAIAQSCGLGCAAEEPRSAPNEYTLIGNDPPPWYCSKMPVYIEFHFEAAELHDSTKAEPSDKLSSIILRRWLVDCM